MITIITDLELEGPTARDAYSDSQAGSDGGWDDSEYKPQACEVSQSESSGESKVADLEEEEVEAPNKTKVSQKGKNKPNRQDVQAARRRGDTTDTTGKPQTATSDGKRKAANM